LFCSFGMSLLFSELIRTQQEVTFFGPAFARSCIFRRPLQCRGSQFLINNRKSFMIGIDIDDLKWISTIISWMNCTIAKYRWTGFFCVSRAFCIVCFRSLGLIVSHTGAPRECLRCRLSSLNFFQDWQNCCNFTSQMTRIRAVQFSHSEDGSLTAPYMVVPLFKNLIPLLTSPFYQTYCVLEADFCVCCFLRLWLWFWLTGWIMIRCAAAVNHGVLQLHMPLEP